MPINKISYFIILSYIVLFVGCAKPETITTIQYKEKLIPVRCEVTLPLKPKLDENNPHDHTNLIIYYKNIEMLLRGCITNAPISK